MATGLASEIPLKGAVSRGAITLLVSPGNNVIGFVASYRQYVHTPAAASPAKINSTTISFFPIPFVCRS